MVSWRPTSGEPSQLWQSPKHIISDTWGALERLEEDRSIHQIVDVADHVAHGHDLEPLIKRALLSSSFVVLKMPTMNYRQQGPDEYLAGYKDGWDMSPEQHKLEQLILTQQLQQNDFCLVLPQSMYVSTEASGGDALEVEMDRAQAINQKIQKLEQHIYSLPVGADFATVRRLLRQDGPQETLRTGLLMPDLQNLSLQEMTQLRKDYEDGFVRLRYALKKYLDGLAEYDKERQFAELIEEIDYECRKAEDEFKIIQRKHQRSLGGMVITASLMGIAALGEFAMPGMLTAATTALGSITLTDVVKHRIAKADQVDELAKSDFWVAWKIHQENLRKAKGRSRKK